MSDPEIRVDPENQWLLDCIMHLSTDRLVEERDKVLARIKELELSEPERKLATTEERLAIVRASVVNFQDNHVEGACVLQLPDLEADESGPIVAGQDLSKFSKAENLAIATQLGYARDRLPAVNNKVLKIILGNPNMSVTQADIAPLKKADIAPLKKATLIKYLTVAKKLADKQLCIKKAIEMREWKEASEDISACCTKMKCIPTLPESSPMLTQILKHKMLNLRLQMDDVVKMMDPKKKEKTDKKRTAGLKAMEVLDDHDIQPKVNALLAQHSAKMTLLDQVQGQVVDAMVSRSSMNAPKPATAALVVFKDPPSNAIAVPPMLQQPPLTL
eukprot:gene24734-10371_t